MTEIKTGITTNRDLTSVVFASVISRNRQDVELLSQEQLILYLLSGSRRGSMDTDLVTPQEIDEIELKVPDLTLQIARRDALPRNSFSVPSPDDEMADEVAKRLHRLELVDLIAGLAIFESDGELVKRDAFEISIASLMINHPDYIEGGIGNTVIINRDNESDADTAESKGAKLMASLNERQWAVARLWHRSAYDISEALVIEESTVRSHKATINEKAGRFGLTDDTVTIALFESGDLEIDKKRIDELVEEVKPLTDRQLDCFILQMQGLSYEEIGDELSLSPNTVRTHLHAVSNRLGGRNSRENAIIAHCSEVVDFVL